MADRCNIETQAMHFQSESPPRLELKGKMEGDHQLFQDTELLFDTVVLDSYFDETQLETLDFDTQVIDGDDCVEEEIVLDSEDEGNSVVAKKIADVKACRRIGSQERRPCQASCGSAGNPAKAVMIVEKSTDEEESLAKEELNYTGSEEPKESSQENALNFVNHYLSLNSMDLSPEVRPRNAVRKKVSPISSIKGCHKLAKQIEARSKVGKCGTFEWIDNNHCEGVDFPSKGMDVTSALGASSWSSAIRHRKAIHVDCNAGGSEEKSVSLHKEVACPPLSGYSPRAISSTEQGSKVDFENDSPNEQMLTAELAQDMDTCEIERKEQDIFDVGFCTQMAAETLEALACGLPTESNAGDVHQYPQNLLTDSSPGVEKSRTCTKRPYFLKVASPNVERIATTSKQRKNSARKGTSGSFLEHISNQELDDKSTTATKRKKSQSSAGRLNGMNPTHPNEHSAAKTPKPVKKRKKGTDISKNNTKYCEKHVSPSITFENIVPVDEKMCIQKEPVSYQSKSWMTESALKAMKHGAESVGQAKHDSAKSCTFALTYKRKRSCLSAKPSAMLNSGKISEQKEPVSYQYKSWMTESALKAMKNGAESAGQAKHDSAKSCTFALTYKRKRSCLSAKPSAVLNSGKICEQLIQGKVLTHQTGCQEGGSELEDIKDGLCNQGKWMNDIKDSLITYKRKVSSKSNLSEAFNAKDKHAKLCHNIAELARNNKLTHNIAELARNNKLTQQKQGSFEVSSLTGYLHLNAWDFPKRKRTLLRRPGWSNEANSKSTSFTAISQKGRNKRPFSKNFPKSSLLKELIRLGIPEPKPGTQQKDLRKRRDTALVQVLFSQHLDDDIIKQQKKIMARLGIPIASCSMDATHFIADKFARTRNMLEAIASGKLVVNHLWLESCGQASCLIDEKNYILRDAKKEKEIGFSMPMSLARARQHPLLKDRRVLITPNVKPGKEMITSLVKAVHGQVVEIDQISAPNIPDNLLILSCEEDQAICLPFLDTGAAIYRSELLLNGIVIQKLEYERHQLFTGSAKRDRRSIKRSGYFDFPILLEK